MTFGKGHLNSAPWQYTHPCGKSGGAFQNATATNKLNKAVEQTAGDGMVHNTLVL